ncbi:MAG: hypothetical protein BGO93_23470 [Mesorhizobium sp. 65-26]|nr:MAG: hypothetical protein BGO93_23470 [Mesorhizobium sp. 65-26]
MAFALLKGLSILICVLACFGLRIWRLPRFCPFAMAERPFEKNCVFAGRRLLDQLQAVLGGHPLVTLSIVADAVLR